MVVCLSFLRLPSRLLLPDGEWSEPLQTDADLAALRVALTGLTMAEYFREEKKQDVLLFVDNIFRFVQAGSEVSALLGNAALRAACERGWRAAGGAPGSLC